MKFLQFLLTFWLGGTIAYGLSSFAVLKRDGAFQVGTLTSHLFAFITIFIPAIILWPYMAIDDIVKDEVQ